VDVSGVSLPGIPAIIVGSNTHVAWGFTNSYGDWLDWVRIDYADPDRTTYRTTGDPMPIRDTRERIAIAGQGDTWIIVRETEWGPIIHEEPDGSALALRWTAHLPGALDLRLGDLARAGTLDEALDTAGRAGIPAQNIVIGDREGRIGWRLAGRLPHRVGDCDPRAPLRPLDGCDWAGLLPPDEAGALSLRDPPTHRLWTANARVVDGDALALLGDGGYALGARSRQIARSLAERQAFTEGDLLAIQLDDRALFLERWNRLLRQVLKDAGAAAAPDQLAAAEAWNGRASVDSAGYRYTRAFRLAVLGRIQDGLLGPAKVALGQAYVEPDLPQLEGIAWPLLKQRPAHLLPPGHADWNSLLRDAADEAARDIRATGSGPLTARHWGERNTARICHPMADAIPLLGPRFLCMAADPLPGDAQMPRVQGPDFGASQRMVVAPGREAEGILQVAGGQSGHPLSRYWGGGHADWVAGRPTPFLPGSPVSVMTLGPAR
jgi:penicillin amidase